MKPKVAISVALLTLAATAPTRANGRFPNAQQLRELDSRTLVVAGTYGMLVTTNAGADFAYQCEAVLFGKPTGSYTVDPLLETGADGAIYSGSLHALRVSRDRGCTFETEPSLPRNWPFFELERPEGAESGEVVDVCRRGGAAGAPVLALVALLDDASQTTEYRLYETDAQGVFGVVGAPIPVALLDFGLTLEVAPSDPQRIYVTGTFHNDPVLLASEDGGGSFRSSPLVFDDADAVIGAYIGGVSPVDPLRVYLRVARRVQTGDGLYARDDSLAVSSDGGISVSEVLRAQANLLGFAVSPDGASVLAGYGDPRVDETLSSPAAVGIYRADAAALVFEHVVADMDVSCLRFTGAGLYACAVERDPLGADPALSDFHLGVHRGAGGPASITDFTPLLSLRDVRGPAPWADGRTTECAMEWASGDPAGPVPVGTCARLNACESDSSLSDGALVCGTSGTSSGGTGGAGATGGGAAADAGGSGGSDAQSNGGCGCRSAPGEPAKPFGLFGLGLLVLAARRARQAREGRPTPGRRARGVSSGR